MITIQDEMQQTYQPTLAYQLCLRLDLNLMVNYSKNIIRYSTFVFIKKKNLKLEFF